MATFRPSRAACGRFVAELLVLMRTEVARVADQPVQRLLDDPSASAFSTNFDDSFSELRVAAAAAACDSRSLATVALDSVDTVAVRGAVAVALKADIVSDLADRARPPVADGPTLDVAIVGATQLSSLASGSIKTCSELGSAWLRLYQVVLDAMDSVPLTRYLSGGEVRESDIRDNPDGGGGLHFASEALDSAISALFDRGQAIGCSDDAVAREILDRAEELKAHSATATVYKADQLAVAELFLSGI